MYRTRISDVIVKYLEVRVLLVNQGLINFEQNKSFLPALAKISKNPSFSPESDIIRFHSRRYSFGFRKEFSIFGETDLRWKKKMLPNMSNSCSYQSSARGNRLRRK
ncbi:hypothetical protein CDAR_163761 [Caerostris darwini]|uniref:Uncharacterized protein n=1 Tax=Caerostris darwini TaxID=1538125 RepID=A0AAV4RS82_9ARAC|nr:hypothetical protein CDAR_163761 [Caerostris darwini]